MLDQDIQTIAIPALAANIMLRTFGDAVMNFDGWTYITDQSDSGRIQHYAVFDDRIEHMDYSPFEVMPRAVFKWMVQLDFPERRDLAQATQFKMFVGSPLSSVDVERLWLWRQVNEVAA